MTRWSVGELAALAGVTVRTLHHFDAIGLLPPAARSASGYREYDDADLARLRQVLLWRELGFPLEQVARLVAEAGGDEDALLARHEELLTQRADELRRLADTVGEERRMRRTGMRLTPQEQLAVFGQQPVREWAEEAEQRWGDTDAFAESRRRTAAYTKADWERIHEAAADLDRRLAAAMEQGLAPGSRQAMELAEEHRLAIDSTYYPCGHAMHRGLGAMYLADERFTQRYEDVAPGLAQYLHDAIHANADRSSA